MTLEKRFEKLKEKFDNSNYLKNLNEKEFRKYKKDFSELQKQIEKFHYDFKILEKSVLNEYYYKEKEFKIDIKKRND